MKTLQRSLRVAPSSRRARTAARPTIKALMRWLRLLPVYLVLVLSSLFFILPFLWMVSGSLKSMVETFAVPPSLVPKVWLWSNYPKALTYVPFLLYLRNSLFVCVGNVVGTMLSCTLVAYSLSRIRWWGQTPLFVLALASMMLPSRQTGMTL